MWIPHRSTARLIPLLFTSYTASAQIATDGTLGPQLELQGPDMTIGAELGQTRGGNLFHSFQRFNIPTHHSATFTGPETINHVVSRVTGGELSQIDGTLRSEVGQADLYLINPAGVVMGPNATVDVPASLHVSTADELRFADGSRFSARDLGGSTLTLAAPEAFGFLGRQPPGNLTLNGTRLAVGAGQTLSLSGGDLAIQGSEERPAVLNAPGGRLQLEAAGNTAMEMALNEPTPLNLESTPKPDAALPHRGQLDLNWANLSISGKSGGYISLSAGKSTLMDTFLAAGNLGPTNATGGIEVNIANLLHLNRSGLTTTTAAASQGGITEISVGDMYMDNSDIISNATRIEDFPVLGSIGSVGDVMLNVSGSLTLDNGSLIQSATSTDSDSGNLTIDVGEHLKIFRGSTISAETFGAGNAGNIMIQADSAVINGFGLTTKISTGAYPYKSSPRNAGHIMLNIADSLELTNGALISTAHLGTAGDAGSITVRAKKLNVTGGDYLPAGFIGSIISNGKAGDISIDVSDTMMLNKNTNITVSNLGKNVHPGNIIVHAGNLKLNGGSIDNQAWSASDAGNLTLRVNNSLELLNEARISTDTQGNGNAGKIDIQAGSVRIDGGGQRTGVWSDADPGDFYDFNSDALGHAGEIVFVIEDQLEMLNGGIISSDTYGRGNAGNLHIRAHNVYLGGGGSMIDFYSRISTQAKNQDTTGHAGTIDLQVTNHLEVCNYADVIANTFGVGDAGDIRISAKNAYLNGHGQLTNIASQAESGSQGNAGNVILNINNLLEVRNGSQIAASTFGAGDAGKVQIDAGMLRLDGHGLTDIYTLITSSAEEESQGGDSGGIHLKVNGSLEIFNGAQVISNTFSSGNAGGVFIEAGSLLLDGGETYSLISTSAEENSFGNAGNIKITISGALQVMNGGAITSDAFPFSFGHAGIIDIETETAYLDGGNREDFFTGISSDAIDRSLGNAGSIYLKVHHLLQMVNNAAIQSDTSGYGDAGHLHLELGEVYLDGSRISSASRPGFISMGDGGNINLQVADLLKIQNRSLISTNTATQGDAGNISIVADNLQLIDSGISSAASSDDDSGGQAGNIDVWARRVFLSEALVINSMFQSVPADRLQQYKTHHINFIADQIDISNSKVTTLADGNLPAANIHIDASKMRLAGDSQINTQSLQSDGGSISMDGGWLLVQDSQITTTAGAGNAGAIRLSPKQLILDSGFIQANSISRDGGNIRITPQVLLHPATQSLSVGGTEHLSFNPALDINIIQAVAPQGVSGQIDLTPVAFDITAALVPLRVPFADPNALLSDHCQIDSAEEASTLIEQGTGGRPPAVSAPISGALSDERLKRLLSAP